VLKTNVEETLIIQYNWEAYETLKKNMRNATQFDGFLLEDFMRKAG
jgi:hypothetical protein